MSKSASPTAQVDPACLGPVLHRGRISLMKIFLFPNICSEWRELSESYSFVSVPRLFCTPGLFPSFLNIISPSLARHKPSEIQFSQCPLQLFVAFSSFLGMVALIFWPLFLRFSFVAIWDDANIHQTISYKYLSNSTRTASARSLLSMPETELVSPSNWPFLFLQRNSSVSKIPS